MNYVLLFAGGVGKRMNSVALPKQFLEVNGKPVIIHTIEQFEEHAEIDGICIVCVSDWMDHMQKLLAKYCIQKVRCLVPGGETALDSQYQGLIALKTIAKENDIVLIHDGVRPMINAGVISECISSTKRYGSGVCVAPATETIVRVNTEGIIESTVVRSECAFARAPQTFYLNEILAVHEQAIAEGKHNQIDSATMMLEYGRQIHTVMGPAENLKVTTPLDFYILKALLDAKEAAQLFGV